MELEQIVVEIYQVVHSTMKDIFQAIGPPLSLEFEFNKFSLDKARRYIDISWTGKAEDALQNTTTFEPIPTNRRHLPYVLEFERDFDIDEFVKPAYQRVFKSSKLPPCKFMQENHRECRFLTTKAAEWIGKRSKQELLLKHLLNFDHFECFGKKKPMCDYHKNNNKCIHFENVLNNKSTIDDNFDEYFNDYRHLYLYFHKTNNRNQSYNHGSWTPFEFLSWNDVRNENEHRELNGRSRNLNYNLIWLFNEVIKNGFVKDLLPRDDVDPNVDGVQLIKNTVNRYSDDIFADTVNFDPIRKQLAQQFKIFEKLDEKMNHERHKQMGYPLNEYQMLSLILYCNGECNHSLCQAQRDGTSKSKWIFFDIGLDQAIDLLAKHEIHDENIYTGLAGIFLDVSELYCLGPAANALEFKTNVSFSRDLRVAREFRGDEGLMIGINLQRVWLQSAVGGKHLPYACDVSWISRFPTEQEILVAKGVRFHPCPSKSRQIGKKQWIVCNHGDDDKISFENMFLSNNNVLV